MAHLDNLIQTLGLRLRFCPPQPRRQLGRVAANSSSCHASKQTSRFHSLHPDTTNKLTGNVNIRVAASRRSRVLQKTKGRKTLPITLPRGRKVIISFLEPPRLNYAVESSALANTSGMPQTPPSNYPLLCPRENTLAALWEQIQRVQVIHVRGTPTSGKSILARLFRAYVKTKRPDIDVHLFNWPVDIEGKDRYHLVNYYHLLNDILKQPATDSDTWLGRQNTLIIIDEAQRSYKFHNIWDQFIKTLASSTGSGPFVVLFSSFGSPAGTPVEVPFESGTAPVQFRPDQRVSIQALPYTNPNVSLYFSREEFSDAVARLCKKYRNNDGNAFIPSEELMQHIWELTNGHPGGVLAVLEILIHSKNLRPFRKGNLTIPLDAALEVLDDDEGFAKSLQYGYDGFSRSLPTIEGLQRNPDLTRLLKGIIASGQSGDKLESNTALNYCYKKGWLQAELLANEKEVYIFPSKLHERYAKILLNTLPEFPRHRFSSVRQLCFEAISKFCPTLLSSTQPSLRAGAVVPPKEAEYTHELSRACYHILGQNLFLTPEWRGSSSNGQVDFYIKSVKWAIECVREGDRLDQRIARFQPGGRYYPLIATEEISDYILLDFRTSKPNKNRDDIPFLYFIVFSKDYTSYEIYDAKLNLVVERVALVNHNK